MRRHEIIEEIKSKHSFLCVGLDTELAKLPAHLKGQPLEQAVLDFNTAIIDATAPYAVSYKPNIAFYEAMGGGGMELLKETISYIKKNHPRAFVILDAKRGDIGNTSRMYAKALFEGFGADCVTVAPYMGSDSVGPFLESPGKWVALLALTSNTGSQDFQHLSVGKHGEALFEYVICKSEEWGNEDQIMFVAGATQAELFGRIRAIAPNHFLLVPGVGAQGGSLTDVCYHGLTGFCGLLINSSRGIIYASSGEDFAEQAAATAQIMQQEMAQILSARGIVSEGGIKKI